MKRKVALLYLLANLIAVIYMVVGMPSSINALKSNPENADLKFIYNNRIDRALELFKKSPEISKPKCYIYFGINEPMASYWPQHFITISENIVRDYPLDELSAVLAHEISHAQETARNRKYGDNRPHWKVDLESTKFVEKSSVINALKRLRSHRKEFWRKHPIFSAIFPIIPLANLWFYYEITRRIESVSSAAVY